MDDRLDMRIKAGAVERAHRYAPWRPDIPWWQVGIQAAVLVVLGLWLLLNQGAGEPVLAVLGLALLVIAGAWAWSAMRSDLPQVVMGWRGLRGGIGIAGGVLLVLDFGLDFLTPAGALVVFSIVLLLAGLVGVAEWYVGRATMAWRWPSLIGSVIAVAYGLVMVVSRLQAGPLFLQVLSVTLLVVGVALLVRAGLLWRQAQVARPTPPPGGGPSAAVAVPQALAGAGAPSVTARSAGAPKGGDAGRGASGSQG